MSELRKQKQAAIEAVARHFSATWEGGEETADAYVTHPRERSEGRSLETRARSMARCRRRGRSVACRDVSVRPSPAIDRDRLQEDSGSAGWWTDRASDPLRGSCKGASKAGRSQPAEPAARRPASSSRRRGFKLSVSVPREVLGRCSSEGNRASASDNV